VSFGEKTAFEDTLNEALDSLFGGDSGANAGDVLDTEPAPADDADAATEPDTDAAPAPEEDGEPGSGIVISTELRAALADARAALLERGGGLPCKRLGCSRRG